jgi:hypothetical protein
MKRVHEIKNLRMIKVSFLAPTNTLGARIKIYEVNRYNDEKSQSKTFGYDYQIGDTQEQAYQILVRNNFNVICRASEYSNYILLCDNWSDEFINIKDLK